MPEVQGRIREILDIIESQSPQKISQLALEVNLSQSRLQHLFKQETGVGLGRLLTEQRLQKAATLLVRTRLRKLPRPSCGYLLPTPPRARTCGLGPELGRHRKPPRGPYHGSWQRARRSPRVVEW